MSGFVATALASALTALVDSGARAARRDEAVWRRTSRQQSWGEEPARGRLRPRNQRGMTQGIQWAILVPIVLLAVLGGIQTALVLQARACVANAALAAAQTEAVYGDVGGTGVAAAHEVVRSAALSGVNVSSTTGTGVDGVDRVSVTVSGAITRVIPFGPATVSATATVPKER